MRIRRARPKYLALEMLAVRDSSMQTCSEPKILYFNRGSAVLKFLLQCQANDLGRPPIVCLQSFNCPSVLDAALESGAKVILSDIKLTDCSLPLSFLEENDLELDVLVLLHYQGRRNTQHKEIAEYCRVNKIVLVEDLAHCPDHSWPLLGDYGIYSYAFDKPFSCMHGGGLVFGPDYQNLHDTIKYHYERLPVESVKKEKRDLRLLRYLFEFSDPSCYESREGPHEIIVLMQQLHIPDACIHTLLSGKYTNLPFRAASALLLRINKLFTKQRYPVSRIGALKVALLQRQRQRFSVESKLFISLSKSIADNLRLKLGVKIDSNNIAWNRLSFFCPRVSARMALKSSNMEVSNYNWPVALHTRSQFERNMVLVGTYPNSEYACENIINVPVWTSYVIDAINKSRTIQDCAEPQSV